MISGKTILYGLFGYPVKHTLSPKMHNAAFKNLRIKAKYVPFEIKPENLETKLKSLVELGFGGINVTVPHKESCMRYLDEIDKNAKLIGAVNTIKVEGSKLIGYNTDGLGFLRSLKENNINIDGSSVLILGAGGASRAISVSMLEKVDKVYIYDIDSLKAKALIDDLNNIIADKAVFLDKEDLKEKITFVNILVNATPVGLKQDESPIEEELLSNNLRLVYDLIYNPPVTKLLKAAQARSIATMNGLGMLIYQGMESFKIWTGVDSSFDVMKQAVS